MARLKIRYDNGVERVHDLADEVTTVGRASSNVIQLMDEKSSRQHFKIEREAGKFVIVDMGSTNGTRLNGQRVVGTAMLRSGDEITLGKTRIVYEEMSQAAAPSAAAPGPATAPTDGVAPHAEPKYVLKVLDGKNAGKVFDLGVEALTIGRHANNTFQIDDPAVSNYHAEINREPVGYVITDLGSTNGTKVKPLGKPEFEKIVKTPLSVGMQIHIGKTLLEFQNLGAPVADEALFGTVALDPQKLEAQLDSAGAKKSKLIPVLIAIILLLGLAAWAAPTIWRALYTPPPSADKIGATPPGKSADDNRISNADFDQGTDDEGNPREFHIARGSPGIQVKVVPEADRLADKRDSNRLGLMISKSGAKSISALTVVETRESFPVDAGKVYEFSGWMRNDGDGLYGLRVTWLQSDRAFSENPVVLKETQEWKQRTCALTPPAWAERARAGIFVQGKEGKACFDELMFKEKAGTAPLAQAAVKFGGIALTFEGTKGAFSAASEGKPVIEDGTLRLVAPDGAAASDLSSAIEPQLNTKPDGSSAGFTGRIYDFALPELTNYKIDAGQGAGGVDLRVAMDSLGDAASKPELGFYLVGPVALGDIEISKGEEPPARLPAGEDKTTSGVQSLLFNAGKSSQLALSFSKPAEVEIKRAGKRRQVVVRFGGELLVLISPEDLAQKKNMTAAIADLQKALQFRAWGETEAKMKLLNDKFGARFPLAKDEAARAREKLDAAWKDVQEELKRTLSALQVVANSETLDKARQTVSRQLVAWNGSEKTATLNETLAQIDGIARSALNDAGEKKAEEDYKNAENYFNKKLYQVAIPILKVKILENPDAAKTRAGEKAKELLAKAEAAQQRQDELNRITDRLKGKINSLQKARDYAAAVKLIETDKEFQENKDDLPEIQALLTDLRRRQ